MPTQDLLRAQHQQAHDVLEQVIDDCSPEALANVAGGNIGAISAIYAHAVYGEDGMLALPTGRAKVWESDDWAAKTGLDMPSMRQTQEWAQSSPQYDLAAFREYAQAVYATTDDYLANISDDGLETEFEFEPFVSKTSIARYVGTVCLWHVISHQGEIAALKGVQGPETVAVLACSRLLEIGAQVRVRARVRALGTDG